MKAYLRYNFIKEIKSNAILAFIIVFLASCSSTKYLNDNQAIIKKITLDSLPKEIKENAYNYIRKDIIPNPKIGFGTVLYNLLNTKKGKYKTENIRNLGTPPVILDSNLVEISKNQLERYIKSEGFFNAKVKSYINIKNKKARIRFVTDTKSVFLINDLQTEIADTTLKSLYNQKRNSFTHLHKGAKFNEDSLVYDRDKLYQIIKENGYYNFSKSYIRLSLDSNLNNNKVNIKLIIDNPKGKTSHNQYTIGKTDILIAPNFEGLGTDSVQLKPRDKNGLSYTDLSKKINPKVIARYNYLRENETFNIENESLTYDRLYDLNIFKSIKIDYNVNDSTKKVNPFLFFIPQQKMINNSGFEISFNQNTSDLSLNNTFVNNNLFRGAERLEIQTKGVIRSLNEDFSFFKNIYYRDFLISTNLTIPKLLAPYNYRLKNKHGTPSTTISLSYLYSSQENISIRQIYLANFRYDWYETKTKVHSVVPLNFEYKSGSFLLDTTSTEGRDFFNKNRYYVKLFDRKDLTLGLKYSYSLNANKLRLNTNFVYLRAEVDIAGNALSLASKIFDKTPENNEPRTALGLPFNQYIRPEIDFRWYRKVNNDNQFVFRINAGFGFAYENSKLMPFEKLFFAGGSNGIRAWQARTIGPGNYNRSVLSSEDQRKTLFGIDQLGEMKIESSLEYRYLIFNKFLGGKLKGATFLDAGNTWNISHKNSQSVTQFNFEKLGSQIALGTGIGLRFDIQYAIIRIDLGLKIKDPQFEPGEQWVIKKLFKGTNEFKEKYLLTNAPDSYRFLQWNFGIGFPF